MKKLLMIVQTLISAAALSQSAAVTVSIAGPNAASSDGSGAAPTNVTASPWPFTALVFFTAPAAPPGKTISGYKAAGVAAPWIHGSGPSSPIMAQGGEPGWSGNSVTFSVVATYSDGSTSAPSAASNAVRTTAGSKPTTSPNVYVGGVFNWEGDYDFGGAMNYTDVTGNPSAKYDLYWCTGSQGGWLPFAPQNTYDLTPYKYMNLDLKPTTAGKTWDISFFKIGDVLIDSPAMIDASGTYGPVPQPGVWATYKIPLSAMGVGPGAVTNVYKFLLHDNRSAGANCWYAQNIYFSAN
jgi:hypothetical protein